MSSRIDDLEPATRGMCGRLLAARPDIRVTWTLRTMDEQLHLYAQGRMFVNGEWAVVDRAKIVTKAAPGKSPHNPVVQGKAAAFDICFKGPDPYLHAYQVEHGKPDPRWLEVGTLGEELGLNWGGPRGANDRFTFDSPHFELAYWRTLRDTDPQRGAA